VQRAGGAGCCGWVEVIPDDASLPGRRRAAGIGDTPDRAAAILGDKQRAILADGHADGPAPHCSVVDDESGDEILVLTGWHTVLYDQPNDLVAGALGAIP